MKYKLTYHKNGPFAWGVTMYLSKRGRWVEQAQFLLRMDALKALQSLNQRGYL